MTQRLTNLLRAQLKNVVLTHNQRSLDAILALGRRRSTTLRDISAAAATLKSRTQNPSPHTRKPTFASMPDLRQPDEGASQVELDLYYMTQQDTGLGLSVDGQVSPSATGGKRTFCAHVCSRHGAAQAEACAPDARTQQRGRELLSCAVAAGQSDDPRVP